MKKVINIGKMTFVCFSLMIMAAGVLLLSDGKAMAADTIKLVLETAFPQTSGQSWGGTGKPWTDAVTKRAKGAVEFDTHFGGELANLKAMVKATGSGLVQVGSPYVGYFPSQFPVEALLGTLNYPGFTPSDPTRMVITRVLFAKVPAFNEAYEKNNIKKIFTISVPNVGVVSRLPISTLDDFKGLKIRTFGKYMSMTMRAAGAIPVTLSYSEMLDALSKKVVAGTITNFSKARDDKMYEIAPHVVWLGTTNMPAHVIPYSYVMNLDAWNKLPKQIKLIMLEEGKRVEMEYALFSEKEQMIATKEMEGHGATIHTLSQNDMDEWKKRCGDMGAMAAKDLDGKGLPGTQTMEIISKLAKLPMPELMAEFDKAWEKEFSMIQ